MVCQSFLQFIMSFIIVGALALVQLNFPSCLFQYKSLFFSILYNHFAKTPTSNYLLYTLFYLNNHLLLLFSFIITCFSLSLSPLFGSVWQRERENFLKCIWLGGEREKNDETRVFSPQAQQKVFSPKLRENKVRRNLKLNDEIAIQLPKYFIFYFILLLLLLFQLLLYMGSAHGFHPNFIYF